MTLRRPFLTRILSACMAIGFYAVTFSAANAFVPVNDVVQNMNTRVAFINDAVVGLNTKLDEIKNAVAKGESVEGGPVDQELKECDQSIAQLNKLIGKLNTVIDRMNAIPTVEADQQIVFTQNPIPELAKIELGGVLEKVDVVDKKLNLLCPLNNISDAAIDQFASQADVLNTFIEKWCLGNVPNFTTAWAKGLIKQFLTPLLRHFCFDKLPGLEDIPKLPSLKPYAIPKFARYKALVPFATELEGVGSSVQCKLLPELKEVKFEFDGKMPGFGFPNMPALPTIPNYCSLVPGN